MGSLPQVQRCGCTIYISIAYTPYMIGIDLETYTVILCLIDDKGRGDAAQGLSQRC